MLNKVLKENRSQLKQSLNNESYKLNLEENIYLIKLLLIYSKKEVYSPYLETIYYDLDEFKLAINDLVCFSGYYLNLSEDIINYFENFNFEELNW